MNVYHATQHLESSRKKDNVLEAAGITICNSRYTWDPTTRDQINETEHESSKAEPKHADRCRIDPTRTDVD